MHNRLFAATLLAAILNATPHASAKILQRWDFEGRQPFHGLVIEGEPPQVIPDPGNPANHVMCSVLRPGAKRPERSEVKLNYVPEGEERWVGVRIRRPNATQNGFTSFFQLGPMVCAPGALFQLAAYGKEGNCQWNIRGYLKSIGAEGIRLPVGKVVCNKWENWVFHIKVKADESGLVEVWRDGQPVFRREGRNASAGAKMPVKWGIYVGTGNKAYAEITAYYDDITIGDANSSLHEVGKWPVDGQP